MEGSISARTEKAQNRRCEEGFESARGKAELKKGEWSYEAQIQGYGWLGLCIMSNGIELIEIIVNIF